MPISAQGRLKPTVTVLLAFLALVLILPLAAKSSPPLLMPSHFWGTVKLNGQDVPDGTVVSVWSADWSNLWKQTTTFTPDGESVSVYKVLVMPDDPETDPVEGPVIGEIVRFKIGDHAAFESYTWKEATNTELNLTTLDATPTPSPTASATPTSIPSPSPTSTRTPTSTPNPTATSTPTATLTTTATSTATATATLPPMLVITGSIGGLVWLDENRNGVLDNEEGGIPDVRIEVWVSIAEEFSQYGLGLQPELYTHTDQAGYYYFEVVPIGDYVVWRIDLEGAGPEISTRMPVTVIAGQMVEANFRDVPFAMRVYLPLFMMDNG